MPSTATPESTSIAAAIAERLHLRRTGNRFVGPCPDCGGQQGATDKFQLWDDAGFKCYACGISGDGLRWQMEREGKSCPAAHTALGLVPCPSSTCPAFGSCRHGDGSGRTSPPVRRRPSLQPQAPAASPALPAMHSERHPSPEWISWASALQEKAAATLQAAAAPMQYLNNRGISAATAAAYGLGYLPHDQQVDRAALGLPPRASDGKQKLWVPSGLLIAIFHEDTMHRLRVRREQAARDKFLPALKYVWLDGSGNRPLVLYPSAAAPAGALIVEAELDAIACHAAAQELLVIAIGTVRGPLPADVTAALQACPVILVSLDADTDSQAGQQAVRVWLSTYRQAKYWPPPAGKDAGEYASLGDLSAWLRAGLPPVPVSAPPSAAPVPPACVSVAPQSGGGGEQQFKEITLDNGETIYVTANQPVWEQLVYEGKIVFSENELLRLQQACTAATPEQRWQMIQAAIDTKKVFPGSYIRAGRDLSAAPTNEEERHVIV